MSPINRHLQAMGLVLTEPAPAPGPVIDEEGVRRPAGLPPPAKAGWEHFLIASKKVAEAWPSGKGVAQAIMHARRLYDAGSHELTSLTTPEGWVQLYSIPRREAVAPRKFFFS